MVQVLTNTEWLLQSAPSMERYLEPTHSCAVQRVFFGSSADAGEVARERRLGIDAQPYDAKGVELHWLGVQLDSKARVERWLGGSKAGFFRSG